MNFFFYILWSEAVTVHMFSAVCRCSTKYVFLKTSQNLQESTCVGVSFLISFIEIDWKLVFTFNVQKKPLGAVLEKSCSEVFFCLGIWGAMDNTTSYEDKSCWWKRTHIGNVLLRIYLFAWDIEVFNREDKLGKPLQT